jgi:hypothetical protein
MMTGGLHEGKRMESMHMFGAQQPHRKLAALLLRSISCPCSGLVSVPQPHSHIGLWYDVGMMYQGPPLPVTYNCDAYFFILEKRSGKLREPPFSPVS